MIKKSFFNFTVYSSGLLAILLVTAILSVILYKGAGKLSLEFLMTPSQGAGDSGGVYYQLVGTLILIVTTVIVVTPFAISLSLLDVIYLKNKRLKSLLQIILMVLNSTPSIIFGIVGFMFFVKYLKWDKSWFSGGVILALMILPTVTVAFTERMKTIPRDYLSQSHALGLNEDHLVWSILVPYSWGGLLTGIILGIARAAGETAPIMLTAAVFSGAEFPTAFKDSPIAALPYHIFNLAQDSFSPEASKTAWGAAAVLTLLVLGLSLVAAPFRGRSHEEAKK